MRFLVKISLPTLLAAVLLTACGSGAAVSAGDIAVVGKTHITQGQFDALIKQQKESAGSTFPKQGTSQYQTVKSRVVTQLVQQAERGERAKSDGIKVTDKQIDAKVTQLKQQYASGDQKKWEDLLKKQHLTDALIRDYTRQQLINDALVTEIVKNVKVSDSDVHDYYLKNSQQYAKPQSRDVRHILVKDKKLADSLYQQLKHGTDKQWCTLAKKYSQDPGSKNNCGKLTVSKGQTVPGFDSVAFSETTHVVHAPIHDPTYGYFVIEPLSVIHPRQVTPEKQVAATIRSTLLQQAKNQAIIDWSNQLTKSYCNGGKIKYQVGYTPSPNPCSSSSTTTNTST